MNPAPANSPNRNTPLTELTDSREWLEPDGLGGYASGTASGLRTRRYHGLLLTATTPPTGRVMLVNGCDAWLDTGTERLALSSQRYLPDVVAPDARPSLRSLTCDAFSYYGCWDTPNAVGFPSIYDPRNTTLVNGTLGGTTPASYYYFNPNAFALEPIGQLGNEGRNNFHGPGINNTDLILSKQLRLDEHRWIELRFEAFNVFNHTQFTTLGNAPGLNFQDINSAIFGQVLNAAPGRLIQLGAKVYF